MTDKIIDLGKWKDQRAQQMKEEGYRSYLQSLPQAQLQVEIDHLLHHEDNFFTKGQLILRELSSRAHSSVRKKIEKLHLWH